MNFPSSTQWLPYRISYLNISFITLSQHWVPKLGILFYSFSCCIYSLQSLAISSCKSLNFIFHTHCHSHYSCTSFPYCQTPTFITLTLLAGPLSTLWICLNVLFTQLQAWQSLNIKSWPSVNELKFNCRREAFF